MTPVYEPAHRLGRLTAVKATSPEPEPDLAPQPAVMDQRRDADPHHADEVGPVGKGASGRFFGRRQACAAWLERM